MEANHKDEALFLPFMQIPTGHHHVADAVMEELQDTIQSFHCEKVDILSYSYGRIERLISATYLKWIHYMPKAYDLLYQYLAVKQQSKRSRQILYEAMFTSFFKKLLKENEPSILFCTHALPSNIASVLKQKGQLNAITVNVYTDYFINRIWGIRGIDYHFVPSITVKKFLLGIGVEEAQIFVTGIPVHPIFHTRSKHAPATTEKKHILITGGSLGVGAMERILPDYPELQYSVLCGQNDRLYKRLLQRNDPSITPISYVHDKAELNALYDSVDAVITKPGGVTISECLQKNKPIFTCNALPGQEKVNELELQKLGVVLPLNPIKQPVEEQLNYFFSNQPLQENYAKQWESYHHHLDEKPLAEILREVCPSPS
ncbi:MGDG synthase family glycosyltransferase [Ornithinibacillus contaminans]|uniref:MGDG synthase family glycosyltransferase n=1 Tax=Ornithinibacillus contaminans TaxID=694055 RepID=UPI00064DDB02|nr:UDP-glucuronosyltransferase [Ornithinibacillus contaminans]